MTLWPITGYTEESKYSAIFPWNVFSIYELSTDWSKINQALAIILVGKLMPNVVLWNKNLSNYNQ